MSPLLEKFAAILSSPSFKKDPDPRLNPRCCRSLPSQVRFVYFGHSGHCLMKASCCRSAGTYSLSRLLAGAFSSSLGSVCDCCLCRILRHQRHLTTASLPLSFLGTVEVGATWVVDYCGAAELRP